MAFAKLFETQDHGQILIKLDAGDDGPEVRFYFQPKGLGVCSVVVTAKDTEKGWDAMESAFTQQTEETASKVVRGVKDEMGLE